MFNRTNDGDYILTFGKYSSWKISDVPNSYLEWIEENFSDEGGIKEQLSEIIREELRQRESMGIYIRNEGSYNQL